MCLSDQKVLQKRPETLQMCTYGAFGVSFGRPLGPAFWTPLGQKVDFWGPRWVEKCPPPKSCCMSMYVYFARVLSRKSGVNQTTKMQILCVFDAISVNRR